MTASARRPSSRPVISTWLSAHTSLGEAAECGWERAVAQGQLGGPLTAGLEPQGRRNRLPTVVRPRSTPRPPRARAGCRSAAPSSRPRRRAIAGTTALRGVAPGVRVQRHVAGRIEGLHEDLDEEVGAARRDADADLGVAGPVEPGSAAHLPHPHRVRRPRRAGARPRRACRGGGTRPACGRCRRRSRPRHG